MNVSTDAILFYGICWDEEDHFWPWHPEFGTLPEDQRAQVNEDDDVESDDAWLARNFSFAHQLEIGEHCMASCPMGYVAIAETSVLAWRGTPKKLQLDSCYTEEAQRDQEQDWQRVLENFCEIAGYDFAQLKEAGKVGWFLVSWWDE